MDKELLEALEKKFNSLQTQLKEAQDAGASKEEVEKLHTAIKTQGIALQDFIDQAKSRVIQGFSEQFVSFIGENKDQLAQIVKNKAGVVEFIPKAVGAISTASGGDGVIVPPANHNTQAGGFNLRNDDALVALATVTSTSSASYAYTEYVPKDGDYAFVAEGTAKPEIDFTWQNRYAEPVKIAAYEVLSEEVVTDIPRLESTARELLSKKHGLFKANAVYFGPGTPGTAKGATLYGRVFNPAGMLNLVSFPNIMDVINACITDIYRTHNYTDEAPYEANIALINPVDFFLHLVAAKDQNGLPLYPQAGLFNQVTIGGTTIKPWSKIPVGNIFVADMSKYNVANYVPFSIRIGWINDQFITNQFTMVGESRFFAYVKKLDEQAFIYDSIQAIKLAIEKPIV
jgi:HK97 family phage major capsid protein